MAEHDVLVLGGGTGNLVVSGLADEGMDVGLIEDGPLGGTCLNRGCNPSKKLIQRANVLETIRNASAYGIVVSIEEIPFKRIVNDVQDTIQQTAEEKAERARSHENITWYRSRGRFVDHRTIALQGGERVTADTVVLAGGSRPLIPDSIDGTGDTAFYTSADALGMAERPDGLVIVGGGYIAVEMAHLFAQMGTRVSIVGSSEVLLDSADDEIAQELTTTYQHKHDLHLGYRASRIGEKHGSKIVQAESVEGDAITLESDAILIATGRQPNADRWDVAAANIETDDRGFVDTDEQLRTSAESVYAIGDIAGNHMFKHAGDVEARFVVDVISGNRDGSIEYPGMGYAVFGSPQVGSMGETEESLVASDTAYEVGRYSYEETALGEAIVNEDGFAKVLVGEDDEILGCHVIGPHAATLIHEVSTAAAAGATATHVAETIHVHPALSEIIQGAFRDVRDVAPTGI